MNKRMSQFENNKMLKENLQKMYCVSVALSMTRISSPATPVLDLDYKQLGEKSCFKFATFGNYGKTQCVCVYNLMINGAFRKLGDKYAHMRSVSITCRSPAS